MSTRPVSSWLDPISQPLDGLRRPVEFFFRDDDVGWNDERLFALLDLFADSALPLDLAAIPMALDPSTAHQLSRRIAAPPHRIRVHQHGFSHVNHETTGRKCEFGSARDYPAQRNDIERGRERLAALLGPILDPIFTPPWNRCTSITGQCLAQLGFHILSRDSSAPPLGISGLWEVPIDLDWFAHRKGVRLSREQWGESLAGKIQQQARIGIMFHHALMDVAELKTAAELFGALAGHPRVRFKTLRSLAPADGVSHLTPQ